MAERQLYIEKRGGIPINWFERIAQLNIVDKNTHWQWRNEASNWVTCAVGNRCAILPRNNEGEPDDKELRWMGTDFFEAIKNREAEYAQLLLYAIEDRSLELIREIMKKRKKK